MRELRFCLFHICRTAAESISFTTSRNPDFFFSFHGNLFFFLALLFLSFSASSHEEGCDWQQTCSLWRDQPDLISLHTACQRERDGERGRGRERHTQTERERECWLWCAYTGLGSRSHIPFAALSWQCLEMRLWLGSHHYGSNWCGPAPSPHVMLRHISLAWVTRHYMQNLRCYGD